jgi:hypothetical protein
VPFLEPAKYGSSCYVKVARRGALGTADKISAYPLILNSGADRGRPEKCQARKFAAHDVSCGSPYQRTGPCIPAVVEAKIHYNQLGVDARKIDCDFGPKLHKVNLAGGLTAIVGPNASGKTALLSESPMPMRSGAISRRPDAST